MAMKITQTQLCENPGMSFLHYLIQDANEKDFVKKLVSLMQKLQFIRVTLN